MNLRYLLPVLATICASAALLVFASVSLAQTSGGGSGEDPTHPCPADCPAPDQRDEPTWCEGIGANKHCYPAF